MVDDLSTPPSADDNDDECGGAESALRDNISRKGKNAYYYAHAHRATGPEWDGKIEPRLLSTTSSGNLSASSSDAGIVGGGGVAPIPSSSCRASLMARSNITNYAFLDEDARVRIYVELPGVGNCRDEDVLLDFTERSLCLTVKNYVPPSPKNVADTSVELVVDCTALEGAGEDASPKRGEDRSLSLGRLYAEIEGATFRKKAERVIITLTKKDKKRAWSAVIA